MDGGDAAINRAFFALGNDARFQVGAWTTPSRLALPLLITIYDLSRATAASSRHVKQAVPSTMLASSTER
jgi:hypothetical protein